MVYKASRLANVVLWCFMLDSRSWFSMMFITFFSPDGKVHAKLTQRWRPYHRHPWPLPSCTPCLLAKYLMSLAELDTHFSLKHLQHMCPNKFHPGSASMGPPKLSKIMKPRHPILGNWEWFPTSLTGMITAFLCWFARFTTPPKRNVSRDMLKLPSSLCISLKSYSIIKEIFIYLFTYLIIFITSGMVLWSIANLYILLSIVGCPEHCTGQSSLRGAPPVGRLGDNTWLVLSSMRFD